MPDPWQLASTLAEAFTQITPKWFFQCTESEGHPFSKVALHIFAGRYFFLHQEFTLPGNNYFF